MAHWIYTFRNVDDSRYGRGHVESTPEKYVIGETYMFDRVKYLCESIAPFKTGTAAPCSNDETKEN